MSENKNHLISKAEFKWVTNSNGVEELFESGLSVGINKLPNDHEHDVVDYYGGGVMCSLEDYAIALGLNVYRKSESTYIIK